jgi:peptidoglycan/LPS O-acetylase OafA/YrhL
VDGLRGLAVLLVLLCHCWHLCGKYAIHVGGVNVLRPFEYGYLGVHLFLVLSGFCLALPLVSAAAGADGTPLRPVQLGRFFARRARRILPPYLISIALVVLLAGGLSLAHAALGLPKPPVAMPTWGSIAAHALLVHNFFPAYIFDIAGSYWSLGLEAQFYLLFPLLIVAGRRWGVWKMVAGTLAVTIAYRFTLYAVDPLVVHPESSRELIEIGTGIGWTSLAPGRLVEFALGIAAAVLVVRHGARLRPRACALAATGFLAAGMALTLCWGRFAPLTDVTLGAGFFFAVLTCASLPVARRVTEGRALATLGAASYSIYLVHEPFLHEARALLAPLHLDGWQALLAYQGGLLPLLIALGFGFHVAVERPLLRLAAGRPKSSAPEAAAASVGDQTGRHVVA